MSQIDALYDQVGVQWGLRGKRWHVGGDGWS